MKNKVLKFIPVKYSLFSIGLLVTFLYLSHYYLNGDKMVVYVHDNLDSNICNLKVLADQGYMFSKRSTPVEPIMNGIPRSCFQSPLNVISILYVLFTTPTAYIINEILMHVIAFIGMFFLLQNNILDKRSTYDYIISVGISIIFSILPFWHSGGLSIAGQPFLLNAFLNFRKREIKLIDWLILFLFPLYSSFILSGIFIVILLSSIVLYDIIRMRKIEINPLIFISTLLLLYIVVEYQLVLDTLNPQFISHRIEFAGKSLDFWGSLHEMSNMLTFGQYHSHSKHTIYILPFVLISLPLILNRNNKLLIINNLVISLLGIIYVLDALNMIDINTFLIGVTNSIYYGLIFLYLIILATIIYIRTRNILSFILISIFFISIFYGFWHSSIVFNIKNLIPIIRQIQFDRFYFLLPLLWCLLFVFVFKSLKINEKLSLLFFSVFITAQSILLFNTIDNEKGRKPMPFKSFYAPELYSNIKDYINKPVQEYKIVHIGLNPAVAIYNGFYTLDGYVPNYPLSYKHEFRKIMVKELDKNEKNKKYFDTWGSRCYLFNGSLNRKKWIIESLDINVDQLKGMDCTYIFSKYLIDNSDELNLKLLKVFKHPYEKWSIKLYLIN